MKAGVLTAEDIAGDLLELTRGERSGRRYYDQITVFKSVGTAIEDLAAAQLVCERACRPCGFSSGLAAALKGRWLSGRPGAMEDAAPPVCRRLRPDESRVGEEGGST